MGLQLAPSVQQGPRWLTIQASLVVGFVAEKIT